MNAAAPPPAFPQYFSRAAGARVRDVDGAEYVDVICGCDPIIPGHEDPDVEAAVARLFVRAAERTDARHFRFLHGFGVSLGSGQRAASRASATPSHAE